MPADRRLVWLVRLLLYPASIALIVAALHERGAGARTPDSVALAGATGQQRRITATLEDGRPADLLADVGLTCPRGRRDLAGLWVRYQERIDPARSPRAGLLRVRHAGVVFHWADGRRGTGTVEIDAHGDGASLRGTLRVRLLMQVPAGATCRSGAVPFVLRRQRTLSGQTTQGQRMIATVAGGRVITFRTRIEVECGNRSGWEGRIVVWSADVPPAPVSAPGRTRFVEEWRPVTGADGLIRSGGPLPSGAQRSRAGAGTSGLAAEARGATLRGQLFTSIALPGGSACRADGVRFTLAP